MADAPTPPPASSGTGSTGLQVPPEIEAKYGPLIALIKSSESMNDEERQYWVNILPIMTPEQVQNLQDILDNEKKQLAAIDEKYAKEMGKVDQAASIQKTEENIRKKRQTRTESEQAAQKEEEKSEEEILRQIEGAS